MRLGGAFRWDPAVRIGPGARLHLVNETAPPGARDDSRALRLSSAGSSLTSNTSVALGVTDTLALRAPSAESGGDREPALAADHQCPVHLRPNPKSHSACRSSDPKRPLRVLARIGLRRSVSQPGGVL